jgi:hypothetical protein
MSDQSLSDAEKALIQARDALTAACKAIGNILIDRLDGWTEAFRAPDQDVIRLSLQPLIKIRDDFEEIVSTFSAD